MTQLIGDGHAQAQFPHEPEGGGVEDETDLVRERGAAVGAIRGELCLVELDQILGLAARAGPTREGSSLRAGRACRRGSIASPGCLACGRCRGRPPSDPRVHSSLNGNRGCPQAKPRAGAKPEQIKPARCHILTNIARFERKTLGREFFEDFGMQQMKLAQIGL